MIKPSLIHKGVDQKCKLTTIPPAIRQII